jgi:hypothetical protein
MTMADIDEKVPRPSRQGQYQLSHSCFLIPSKHNSNYKPLGPTKGENYVESFFKKKKLWGKSGINRKKGHKRLWGGLALEAYVHYLKYS